MAEYVLPITDHHAFKALDAFTQGYIEAAFFTECHGDNPELEDAGTGDIAPSSLEEIIQDCAKWQQTHAALLDEAYSGDWDYGQEQAGRDYWFTRNGHGVGFWDRKELEEDGLGDRLSAACRHSEVCVYRGDDGLVYFS